MTLGLLALVGFFVGGLLNVLICVAFDSDWYAKRHEKRRFDYSKRQFEKNGTWIYHENDPWECSNCHADWSSDDDDYTPNYCPDCGSKNIQSQAETIKQTNIMTAKGE